jgi:hypothetical protein
MPGGRVDGPFPNCAPSQGHVLILQNPDSPEEKPNDDWRGGCLILDFAMPVSLQEVGILDLESANHQISVEVGVGSMTGGRGKPAK